MYKVSDFSVSGSDFSVQVECFDDFTYTVDIPQCDLGQYAHQFTKGIRFGGGMFIIEGLDEDTLMDAYEFIKTDDFYDLLDNYINDKNVELSFEKEDIYECPAREAYNSILSEQFA